jgi:hypothetical protein
MGTDSFQIAVNRASVCLDGVRHRTFIVPCCTANPYLTGLHCSAQLQIRSYKHSRDTHHSQNKLPLPNSYSKARKDRSIAMFVTFN